MEPGREDTRISTTATPRQHDREIRNYGFAAAALVVGAIAVMILIRDPARGPDGRVPTGAASGVGSGTSSGMVGVQSPDPEVQNPNQKLQRQP